LDRQNIQTTSPWEASVGFARAVRVGRQVFLAGTLDTDDHGKPIGKDAYEQARNIILKFERVLREAGGDLSHVVRTRMFLTDGADAEAVGRAHQEFFGNVRPAATMVVVAGLAGEGFVVELEADAILP
jgi:enamine deaminase RidA (YjgF/YER057c/UK114 family)